MVGQTLGRYRIVEKVGAGGMGVVYRAIDDRLGRDVAVKVLAPTAFDDPEARARFRQEATALAQLSHPNVAGIYDFDPTDGLDLLVMEFVRGSSLSDRIKSAALPEAVVLQLGTQLAQGLAAAHDAGIVHRDLKPGNIRITPDGRLKILDFGLAKQVRARSDADETALATAQGRILGTLPYMAPEQLRGWPVDARADIHAAGAVIYEMATGRRPFSGATDVLLADQILNHPAAPPRSINASVSAALEQVILKALDKDPAHRYQSAHELAVDLERIALGRLPATGSVPTGPRSATGGSRRRWLLGISAGSVAVAGVTIAIVLMANRPALSFAARDWVLLARVENTTGDPVFDNALDTAFRVSLEQSMHANVFSASRVADALKRMGKAGVEVVDVAVGREICARESIRGLVSPAISQVGKMYSVTTRLIDPTTGDTVRSYVEEADSKDHVLVAVNNVAARLRGDLGESLQAIRRTNMPLAQATTPSLDALKAFTDAQILGHRNDFAGAARLFERALQLDADFALAHSNLGLTYGSFIFNDAVRSREHHERAMALRNRVTERERFIVELNYHTSLDHTDEAVTIYKLYLARWPDDVHQRFNFGNTLRDGNQLDEAIEQFSQAVRIAPNFAPAFVNIATCQMTQRRFKEAAESWKRAFEIEPTWVTSGNLNHEYGFTLVALGQAAKAREVFDLAINNKDLRSAALRSTALLDMYEGKYRSALTRLDEAILVNKAQGATLSQARNLLFRALVLMGQGDRQAALAALAASYRLRDPKSPQSWFWARVGAGYAVLDALPQAEAVLAAVRVEAAPDRMTDRAVLHWLEGELQLAKGQNGPALETLRIAEKESTAVLSPLILDALARAYRATGDTGQAIATYEALGRQFCLGWEGQPRCQAGQYELAVLYDAAKQPDKARAQLDALLAQWQNADTDVPMLQKAKDLRARLDR